MKKIIIPICAAILLIILGVSIYFIVKDKSAEQVNNPDVTISPTVAPKPPLLPRQLRLLCRKKRSPFILPIR
jgi:flagellar basal body-associated protein FliL